MEQLITPNPNINCTPGWCQVYVRKTYSVEATGNYLTALSNWENGIGNHTDGLPSGIQVPVYFSVAGNAAGHVALSMGDGSIYSSSSPTSNTPVHHSSLAQMQDYWGHGTMLTYLGWKEYIEDTQVVTEVQMVDENFLNAFYIDLCNRPAQEFEKTLYIGRDYQTVYNEIRSGAEHQAIVAVNQANATQVVTDQTTISNLQSEVTSLQTQPVTENPVSDIPVQATPTTVIPIVHATAPKQNFWTGLFNLLKGFF